MTVTPVSGAAVVFSASYEIDGIDLMRVIPTDGTFYWAFDMQLSGGTLKLANGTGWYDFDGDGMADPAKWNLEARK